MRAVQEDRPDHVLDGDKIISLLWVAGMRWIVWGFRIVDGEKQLYQLGVLDCKGHALVALVTARRHYGHRAVDHVQSVLSHEIDVLERQRLVFNPYHPRRKKQSLDDAGMLNNIMSSGNTYHEELAS